VLSHSGNRFEYAAALATLAGAGRQNDFALAANDGRYPLLNRIKRITTMEKKPFRSGTVIIAAGIAAVMIAVSIAFFTPALAQQKSKTAKSTARQTPALPVPPAVQGNVAPVAPAPPAPSAGFNSFSALVESEAIFKQLPAIIDSAMAISGEAMKQVDWNEIRRGLREASKDIEAIDWQAIRRETQEAVAQASKDIDWKSMDSELEGVLSEAQHHIDAELDALDEREIRKQSAEERQSAADARKRLVETRKFLAAQRRELDSDEEHVDVKKFSRTELSTDARSRMRAAERKMDAAEARMEAAHREMQRAREEMKRARDAR
jgi:hypothetical protein